MEPYKKLLRINSKSKPITKSPAQDRLRALQKSLQSELQASSTKTLPSCEKEVTQILTEKVCLTSTEETRKSGLGGHDETSKSEICSSQKEYQSKKEANCYNIPNKLEKILGNQISGRIKNSIHERLKIANKPETCTSNKMNEVNKEVECSVIQVDPKPLENRFIQENFKFENSSLEESVQTREDNKEISTFSKIKSLFKSVKNSFNTGKNVYTISDEKKAVDVQKSHDTFRIPKYIKIPDNDNQKTKNNLNNVKNQEISTSSLKMLANSENKNNNSKSNQRQNTLKRRSNEEHQTNEKYNKKVKLSNGTEKNCSTNNSNLMGKPFSNIIPLSPLPGRRFSANERLKNLRQQINATQVSVDVNKKIFEFKADEVTPTNLNIISHNTNLNAEKFKEQFSSNNSDKVLEKHDIINSNLINLVRQNNPLNNFKKDYLYIVPDTNVFLNNLTFLSDLTKSKLLDTNGSVLYIPYIVLQELDRIKMQTERSISVRASRAIKYLNENFSTKNPSFMGQSASESRNIYNIDIKNSDDHIINCCLQLKSYKLNYILLSDDINLRNKAICNQIICSSKDELESNENL